MWQPAPSWPGPQPPVPPRSRERLRDGLLIGLVLVLLAMCGGLAFTAWSVVGPEEGRNAAAGASPASTRPRPSPTASVPGPSPTPVGTPTAPVHPVPAGSAAVPFGSDQVVAWPDGVTAVVTQARTFPLNQSQLAAHPGDIGVAITVLAINGTGNRVDFTLAEMTLFYGPKRTPADLNDLHLIFGTFDGLFGVAGPGQGIRGNFTFAVPQRYASQLTVELRPRRGDVPGRFAGAAS